MILISIIIIKQKKKQSNRIKESVNKIEAKHSYAILIQPHLSKPEIQFQPSFQLEKNQQNQTIQQTQVESTSHFPIIQQNIVNKNIVKLDPSDSPQEKFKLLQERFTKGEISEVTYLNLKAKFEKEIGGSQLTPQIRPNNLNGQNQVDTKTQEKHSKIDTNLTPYDKIKMLENRLTTGEISQELYLELK